MCPKSLLRDQRFAGLNLDSSLADSVDDGDDIHTNHRDHRVDRDRNRGSPTDDDDVTMAPIPRTAVQELVEAVQRVGTDVSQVKSLLSTS